MERLTSRDGKGQIRREREKLIPQLKAAGEKNFAGGYIMKLSSFTGANFTGFDGQTFRFQMVGADGRFVGKALTGQVKRIFRSGRRVSVEMHIPALKCTHTYEAKRIYYKGC